MTRGYDFSIFCICFLASHPHFLLFSVLIETVRIGSSGGARNLVIWETKWEHFVWKKKSALANTASLPVLLLRFIYLCFMYVGPLSECVSVHHVHAVPSEAGEVCQTWNWSYKWL